MADFDVGVARQRDAAVIGERRPWRGKRVTDLLPVLPDADPGKMAISRWRKRLTANGATKTDEKKIRNTVIDVEKATA